MSDDAEFVRQLEDRSAGVYADFLEPHLTPGARVLDCGCGPGTIALGLAAWVPDGRVVGVDRDAHAPRAARRYADRRGIGRLAFAGADAHRLPFASASFDAVLSHSMLETFDDPLPPLREMRRVLAPGGVLAAACVGYDGVLVSGPKRELLRRFYDVKERIWRLDGMAEPRRGRDLRGLLHAAGFREVEASARYLSYGTPERVRTFGRGRAGDCRADWYAGAARRHGLLSQAELGTIEDAWLEWSESDEAFAAFAWCRAVGRA